jgi:hypothetical protein
MIEKDYYRLNELEQKFAISSYDYLYLCENYNIPIRFYIYHQYFLLTEPDNKSRKLNVRGVIDYKGLVEVNSIDRKILLKHSNVQISRCYLIDQKGIGSLESSSDILVDNCLDERYIKRDLRLEELELFRYSAIIIGEENRDLIQQENTPLNAKLTFNFNDVVVTKEDIEWCKLALEIELTNDKPREHIIHNQIKQIMRNNPTLGGTPLYRKVHDNFINENDSTDPYSLYLEVDADEIVWGKAEKYEKTLSKRTFLNLVSKFKKENQ